MPLRLFNTLSRKLEEFIPIRQGEVGFYGCGPTVYNYAHIGNLRAYATHDILTRVLRQRNYTVNHVMNITDVGHLSGDNDTGDDKMVKSAAERGKTVLEIADFYTNAFFNDSLRMNITRPSIVCKATDHISDMIELIKRIEKNGHTYGAGGNLYFDINSFASYGDLSRLRMEGLKARTEHDENKRNAGDFALWFTKSKFENQALVWDSPWGRGYPGWHIECSAMSIKYLGEQFDIHAGGVDHIPIHHTNEIAQSESATGKCPWVKYWIHNEFLILEKGKMSKSSGGFLTLEKLVEQGYDPLDFRYFLIGAHYRSQLHFSWDSLESARNSRKSLLETIRKLAAFIDVKPDKGNHITHTKPIDHRVQKRFSAFEEALDDDLSTPRALAELWGLLRDTDISPDNAIETALQMDKCLGLGLENVFAEKNDIDSALMEKIEDLIIQRNAAKAAKDFLRADEIRNELDRQGIILEDTKTETLWKRKI